MTTKPAKSERETSEGEQAADDLSAIPAAFLAAELRRRKRRVQALQVRYERLIARASAV